MPARVLIVDDDQVFLATMKLLVELKGHQALVASTFEEGRELLRRASPDMLVTDVRLGAFNSLQLMFTAASTIPVIVMSGFDDRVLQAEARSMGAEYLVKPFPPDDLLDRIDRMLLDAAGGTSTSSRERSWQCTRLNVVNASR